jgi:site-specific DNA recombinase
MERKAREGYTNSSYYISYGYDREKGQKVQTINEVEAATVRLIFDMYVQQGMSLSAIAKNLNTQKIPTKRGSFWNSATVRSTLMNCNYTGNVRYGIHDPDRYFEAEGHHEAIISEDLFSAAQILMEKNKRVAPTKKPDENNYFVSFLYCDQCGEKLIPHKHVAKRKDGQKNIINCFICTKRKVKICNAISVTARKVEKALIEYFSQIEDVFVQEGAEAERQEQERRDNEAKIQALRDKLRRLNSKEKDIMSLFINDNIDFDSYRNMKMKLDSDRDIVRTELEKLAVDVDGEQASTISREDIITDFRENWQNLMNTEKRFFLTNFIKKIVVRNEPIENSRYGNTGVTHVEFIATSNP